MADQPNPKIINTQWGRYYCLRVDHDHRDKDGVNHPCKACTPSPRRMDRKNVKRHRR